jgi:hypothetical protein
MSAVGAVLTGVMWSLSAALRSPHPYNPTRETDAAPDSTANSTANAAPHAD